MAIDRELSKSFEQVEDVLTKVLNLEQTTGESTINLMSQKAISDAISDIDISPSTDVGNAYKLGTDGKPYVPVSSSSGVKIITNEELTLNSSDWIFSSETSSYSLTLNYFSEILATDIGISDVAMSKTDVTMAKTQFKEYAKINQMIVKNGEITWICFNEKPTIDLPISLTVLR